MTDSTDPLAAAIKRLDRALSRVEARMDHLRQQADRASIQDSDEDRARLAAELDRVRASEAALAETAQQASQALGEAIAELRAAALASEAVGEPGDG